MNEIKLNDNFTLSGTDANEFYNVLKQMDACTHYETVAYDNIELLSFVREEETTEAEDNKEIIIQRSVPVGRLIEMRRIPIKRLVSGAPEDIVEEFETTSKMAFCCDKRLYFTSPTLMTTLSSRIDISGKHFRKPTPRRDAYIAEALEELAAKEEPNATLMYREIDGTKKVFALFSAKYAKIKQATLQTIVENLSKDLGEPVCEGWNVTHEESIIKFAFPEKAKDIADVYGLPCSIVPKLCLATSDTGICSVTAVGKLSINGVESRVDIFQRKHLGKLDADKVLKKIDETIFSKYTKVPEALCDLLTINVDDTDNTIESVFKQIHIVDTVGKAVTKSLLEAVKGEFTPGRPYTAYDVAVAVLTLPERTSGIPDSVMAKLETCVTKAAFADYTPVKAAPIVVAS